MRALLPSSGWHLHSHPKLCGLHPCMFSIHTFSRDMHAGQHGWSADRGMQLQVVAATSRPNAIDPALRRMGRLDSEVAISLPTPEVCPCPYSPGPADAAPCLALDQHRIVLTEGVHVQERVAIVRLHSKGLPLGADVELDSIAGACHGYSGADLAAVCREAAMCAISEAVQHEYDWVAQPMLPGKGFGEVPHVLSRLRHLFTKAYCAAAASVCLDATS